MGPNQIVKSMASNCEYGLTVAFCIIQSIEQVDAARTRGCDAHAQFAAEFGIAAGGECRCFFMPDLDESDLVLVSSECFENSVYAVARQSEKDFDTPIDQSLNEQISHCFGQVYAP